MPHVGGSVSDGENLRVCRRISVRLSSVMAASDDPAVSNNNGSHRNVVVFRREPSLFNGRFKKFAVAGHLT